MARILIIDDEESICVSIARAIGRMGHEVEYSLTLEDGIDRVSSDVFDVVFLDVRFPGGNGLKALPKIRKGKGSPEVIIMTAEGDPDGAELAIKSGAWDYVEKPASIGEMVQPLNRVLQYREKKKAKTPAMAFKRKGIVGDSQKIRDCLDIAVQAASSDVPVLISGETGTGKELFARSIHENSSRSSADFVVVDCAALPKTLVESLLFGHAKGAFTGAIEAREGLVKQASRGTLFLDEVGELNLSTQKAFLRVLQERRFRPIGGRKELKSDFRLIAATNRNLDYMATRGTFRKDLLYRLRSIYLEVPPLREYREDISKLASFYTAGLCEGYGIGKKGFSSDFLESLNNYEWPGNVRELVSSLENAITKAGEEPTLFVKHLPNHIRIKLASDALKSKGLPRDESTEQDAASTGPFPPFRKFMDNNERRYFEDLMSLTKGNIQEACRVSGLSRSSLYEHLKKCKMK